MPKTRIGVARTSIGLWHDHHSRWFAHPQPLVNHAWETRRRHLIVEYLKSGAVFSEGMGFSYCRFGCAGGEYLSKTNDPSKGEYREVQTSLVVIMGGEKKTVRRDQSGYYVISDRPLLFRRRTYTDQVWIWSEGLAHYVETHGIRLPDEFVAHAAARGFRPWVPGEQANDFDDSIGPDLRFWREWCMTNAPFSYEADCIACNPQRWAGQSGLWY